LHKGNLFSPCLKVSRYFGNADTLPALPTTAGYVYETFGISKHFSVKLQLFLIRAEMLDNPLARQFFIPHVCVRHVYTFVKVLETILKYKFSEMAGKSGS